MKPVAFMRLKKVKRLDDVLARYAPKDLVFQIKDDGYKLFATKDKAGEVRLYTRRGKDVTAKIPAVAGVIEEKAPPGSAFLAELVYIVDRKQSISAVGSIMQSSPARAIEQTRAQGGKLELHVYDVLELDGEDLTDRPLSERDRLVRGIFPSRGIVRTVKNYSWGQVEKALTDAEKQNAEGLVVKPWSSTYKYRKLGQEEPIGDWFKYKPLRKAIEADVLLKDYSTKKVKTVFTAYQYDNGELIEVGKLSGLPRNMEEKVRKMIDSGKEVVAEVSYQERLPSKKLRHMGWIRLRPDKPGRSAKINPSMDLPVENPRTSKVKVALAAQALKYDKFDPFANAYWNQCARGIYWYPTDNPNFDIDAKIQKLAKGGRFEVFCNPLLALAGTNKDKKYVAEINVTNVVRSKISAVKGAQGAKIKIKDLQDAYVMRVLSGAQAVRSWKYQQGLLPSSRDQLRRFWERARLTEKRRKEKLERREAARAARQERRRERLEKERKERMAKGLRVRRRNPEEMTRLIPEFVNVPD
jgi:hypothetical protein